MPNSTAQSHPPSAICSLPSVSLLPSLVPTFFSIRDSAEQSTRFVASTFRHSSAWARVLVALAFVVLAGIGLILVIPIILIAGLVLAITAGVVAVRTWIFREQSPNGVLDGRRNVRVRENTTNPNEPPTSP
jgi:fatty acid desaturase